MDIFPAPFSPASPFKHIVCLVAHKLSNTILCRTSAARLTFRLNPCKMARTVAIALVALLAFSMAAEISAQGGCPDVACPLTVNNWSTPGCAVSPAGNMVALVITSICLALCDARLHPGPSDHVMLCLICRHLPAAQASAGPVPTRVCLLQLCVTTRWRCSRPAAVSHSCHLAADSPRACAAPFGTGLQILQPQEAVGTSQNNRCSSNSRSNSSAAQALCVLRRRQYWEASLCQSSKLHRRMAVCPAA